MTSLINAITIFKLNSVRESSGIWTLTKCTVAIKCFDIIVDFELFRFIHQFISSVISVNMSWPYKLYGRYKSLNWMDKICIFWLKHEFTFWDRIPKISTFLKSMQRPYLNNKMEWKLKFNNSVSLFCIEMISHTHYTQCTIT